MKNRKSIINILALFILILFAVPVMAQQGEPPVTEAVLPDVVSITIGALTITIVVAFIVMGRALLQSNQAARDNISPETLDKIGASFITPLFANLKTTVNDGIQHSQNTLTQADDFIYGGLDMALSAAEKLLKEKGYIVTHPPSADITNGTKSPTLEDDTSPQ